MNTSKMTTDEIIRDLEGNDHLGREHVSLAQYRGAPIKEGCTGARAQAALVEALTVFVRS